MFTVIPAKTHMFSLISSSDKKLNNWWSMSYASSLCFSKKKTHNIIFLSIPISNFQWVLLYIVRIQANINLIPFDWLPNFKPLCILFFFLFSLTTSSFQFKKEIIILKQIMLIMAPEFLMPENDGDKGAENVHV